MNETKHHPRVSKSPIGNAYFYHTRHRELDDGAIRVVGKKTDVTDSVAPLVRAEVVAFLRYVLRKYGLELWDPDPKTEEDGGEYLYGIVELTGYATLNELVAEWMEER